MKARWGMRGHFPLPPYKGGTLPGLRHETPPKAAVSSLHALRLPDLFPVSLPLWVGTARSLHQSQTGVVPSPGLFLQGSKEREMQSWSHHGWKIPFPPVRGMQTSLGGMQASLSVLTGIWVLDCPFPVLRRSMVISDPHHGKGRCQW